MKTKSRKKKPYKPQEIMHGQTVRFNGQDFCITEIKHIAFAMTKTPNITITALRMPETKAKPEISQLGTYHLG